MAKGKMCMHQIVHTHSGILFSDEKDNTAMLNNSEILSFVYMHQIITIYTLNIL